MVEHNVLFDVVLDGLSLPSNHYLHRFATNFLRNRLPPLHSILDLNPKIITINCLLYSILKVNFTSNSTANSSIVLSLFYITISLQVRCILASPFATLLAIGSHSKGNTTTLINCGCLTAV